MLQNGGSLLNLLLACENSKYKWIYQDREEGCFLFTELKKDIFVYVKPTDNNKNKAILSMSGAAIRQWSTEELEKKLGTSKNYFTQIDATSYFMKENVNSMILDGIVDFFSDK